MTPTTDTEANEVIWPVCQRITPRQLQAILAAADERKECAR